MKNDILHFFGFYVVLAMIAPVKLIYAIPKTHVDYFMRVERSEIKTNPDNDEEAGDSSEHTAPNYVSARFRTIFSD